MKVLLNFNNDGTVTCEDWLIACGKIEDEAFARGRDYGFKKGKEAGKEYASEDIAAEKSKAFEDGYAAGKHDGLAECGNKFTKEELAVARSEGYSLGYFTGKRDGEMSKREIPEEVKKHLEEALSWLN